MACRPAALRRTLRNLLENAAGYGDRAMVRVQRDDAEPRIVVEDEGPWIAEVHRERMAELPVDTRVNVVAGMDGKRLRYRELIADNGLDNGARGYGEASEASRGGRVSGLSAVEGRAEGGRAGRCDLRGGGEGTRPTRGGRVRPRPKSR